MQENINSGTKYVWLSPGSRIKGESDMKKFETARKLKSKIKEIRQKYEDELTSSDLMVRQRATALWIIDHLALRVGNEKGEDTADTVGCCSLRYEHIKLKPPRTVKFDFLGKDSMPYKNTVEVDPRVWENVRRSLSLSLSTFLIESLSYDLLCLLTHLCSLAEAIHGGQAPGHRDL